MSLDRISKRIKEIAEALVTVRTGTVISDRAELGKTQVVLDNDPSRTPVVAQALSDSYLKGSRVFLLSYPTSGLLILGSADQAQAYATLAITSSQSVTEAEFGGHHYTSVKIRCVGGGGAGGGAAATGAGQSSVGGGGQGGTYAEAALSLDDLAFPLTATIGAGGTGVSGAAGNNGGTTSVTDANAVVLCSANGGLGGASSAAGGVGVQAAGGRGAASGVGSFVSAGGAGFPGSVLVADNPAPGYGGNSALGGGGSLLGALGNLQGQPGAGYGGGGSGSSRRQSNTALLGGAGANGLIVFEFYR